MKAFFTVLEKEIIEVSLFFFLFKFEFSGKFNVSFQKLVQRVRSKLLVRDVSMRETLVTITEASWSYK